MSDPTVVSNIETVAQTLHSSNKNITLIYAFNGTGKTRLSVAYKDLSKADNGGQHKGVYYNAYSEDLFYWDNDEANNGDNIRLVVKPSTLNQYHSLLNEPNLRSKLRLYKPVYDFELQFFADVTKGIEAIRFFVDSAVRPTDPPAIKISRGEQQTFLWCFFLALFDIEGWTNERSGHFFIDDPVSSLDDHTIFVTAASVMELIEQHVATRKIIITTHHVGFFAILADWLKKGEKAASYTRHVQMHILKRSGDAVHLVSHSKDVFLYHLELLQTLKNAKEAHELYAFHFALLRQVLENIGSFLGVGSISYVLQQIGIADMDDVARIINTLSHKTVFRYEAKVMVDDNVQLFTLVFDAIMNRYNFIVY